MRPYFKKQNHNSKKTMEQEQKRHCDGEGRVEGQRQERIAGHTRCVSAVFKAGKDYWDEEGTSKRERQLE